MKKFNRGGGFGKKGYPSSEGRARKFSGGGFHRPGPGEGDERRGERKIFTASCSVCGAECQVPFRPDGTRPIYCRDCFRQHGVETGGSDRFQRDDRGHPHRFHKPVRNEVRSGPDQSDLVRLLEKINDKLDRILEAVSSSEDQGE